MEDKKFIEIIDNVALFVENFVKTVQLFLFLKKIYNQVLAR